MICSACGADNRPDAKFCLSCGTRMGTTCPNGHPVPTDARFCDECGAPVGGGASPPSPDTAAPEPRQAPAAERRLVSVLFADLVGFTTLSESRDAEEVRDLLTRYFDTCRRIVSLYGGVVEKFIGDAVMAVWGTPIAREDDAERAVRAAMDLTEAIAALGQDVDARGLQARAGVLTGEAAVTIGAEGQGMVAGDLVNTAARIQSAAKPGAVYVGEVTRRATEAAIVYEESGAHELKGKADPVQLWRALRVVAGRGGALKASGLEAPFVGRDREIRVVKELFHASAEGRTSHLVSVVAAPGTGKTRISWEFEKYIDGLVETVWWHRGRCLAYGEGVTYWALAEMVRMRARIVEGEAQGSAMAKLRASVEEHVPDPEERRWVEPRLAHLLGLEERASRDREDLFSAWRLFFERLADSSPTVLVFEDIHWADAALLDFIEYLLDWSRSHPLFVLTLARPELAEWRPSWGSTRSSTSLHLEPLPLEAMGELLSGLVPGLPEELRHQVLERAAGVPLYAVETVRMLLDRGLLSLDGNEYRPTGPIETLEVPETLQALIAARLDGLPPEERRVMQDASVLGKTFSKAALASLSTGPADQLDSLLTSLIRKEFLTVQADPRSPERGQYGFLQDVVRKVAYDTLSRKERRARHLAAAAFLEEAWGPEEEEIVEVVASHFVQAYRAVPDAPDATGIKARARDALTQAGGRASSLAASEEAGRYFEQAIELADEPAETAELHERAGDMAWVGAKTERAVEHFERAIELFEAGGHTHPAARVSARLAETLHVSGRTEEAVARMQEAYQVLSSDEPDEDLAVLLHQLGRLHFFLGHEDEGLRWIEQALDVAETLWLPEVISQALNTKALILPRRRPEEALALLRHALRLAEENDLSQAALRAHYNLADRLQTRDRYDDALEHYRRGLALARKLGNRPWEWRFLSEIGYQLALLGGWDEAIDLVADIPPEVDLASSALLFLPEIHVAQGSTDEARLMVDRFSELAASQEPQVRAGHRIADAVTLRGEGRHAEALSVADAALTDLEVFGFGHQMTKVAFTEALEAAAARGELARLRDLLHMVDLLPAGQIPPSLEALRARFRARLAAARGEASPVEQGFKSAAGLFRELGMRFWLAVTLLEHGEWLAANGRVADGESFLAEAREIFERLRARPWVERLDQVAIAAARVG